MQKTVTGLRLDAKLEAKLARAVEMSGWPKADVLRLALSRGLDDLEAIDYDIDKAIKNAIAAAKASQAESPGAFDKSPGNSLHSIPADGVQGVKYSQVRIRKA